MALAVVVSMGEEVAQRRIAVGDRETGDEIERRLVVMMEKRYRQNHHLPPLPTMAKSASALLGSISLQRAAVNTLSLGRQPVSR
ncbi:hypothetical protein [Brucella endophytica]|uniref:hypothetical protein n=1 Tax=Brucella endophytica TaxID=1963359 RepID=UPI001F2CAA51|nr:hypothetical protein [Brucella endophytica]